MSEIWVTSVYNQAGDGSPNFPNGLTGTAATFTGPVSVGGTLTYEDVTNIDSVGIITARTGLKVTAGGVDVTAGGIAIAGGGINAVGVVTAINGINVTGGDLAVNEKITHVGDTNTAIKFGTDSISLDTAGSLRLQLTNDGKVGINTNNPQKALDVWGPSYGIMRVSTPNYAGDLIAESPGITLRTVGSYPLILNTNQTERLRIGTAGQIGIGGANYGTDGQVLTSKGGSAAVQWTTPEGGAWQLINNTQITSNQSHIDVSLGANAGITTSYAQIKVYYNIWLTSGDKLYVRGGYGFGGSVAADIKTSDYWWSGFYHRAGETAMQWATQGENQGYALISANNNKTQHSGEMIFDNSAGRLSTNGSASWPALVYNTQGFSGGDNDAHNFTVSGQLKGGDNSPMSGFRIYGGSTMTAGEIRTYGLKTT